MAAIAEIERPQFGQLETPEEEWPGEWTRKAHVAQGCGDARDWFTARTHLEYARDAWRAYLKAPPAPGLR